MKRNNHQEAIYRFVVGQMSGDGTMAGRMASVQGAKMLSPLWYEITQQLEKDGFTVDTVGAELDRRWSNRETKAP
jgi:hypothetical protein